MLVATSTTVRPKESLIMGFENKLYTIFISYSDIPPDAMFLPIESTNPTSCEIFTGILLFAKYSFNT